MSLAEKKCGMCHSGEPPLSTDAAQALLKQLNEWHITADGVAIEKKHKFKNFAQALDFTNKIGAIAEEEGHHPDLGLGWGYVQVRLTTHASGGLQENDFIVAAKIDAL
jgi:4a-hydroxytetrahydrobiopterin dehydratase